LAFPLDKFGAEARHVWYLMSAPLDVERLYDEHAQPVFAFLLNLTRHEADTRDLLQEVFVKLAKRPELLDGVRDKRAFLLRLAHNLAIDLIRRRSARDKHYEQLAEEPIAVFGPADEPDERAFRASRCSGQPTSPTKEPSAKRFPSPWANCQQTSARWSI
jgi:RNA polymerase sigma factor (sigma-70 family)